MIQTKYKIKGNNFTSIILIIPNVLLKFKFKLEKMISADVKTHY